MINFLMFILSVVGLNLIMVDSHIMAPIRGFFKKILNPYFYKVFECYQCMGTWCGFLCGYILITQKPEEVICCGFAGSFISTFIINVMNYIEAKTIVDLSIEESKG